MNCKMKNTHLFMQEAIVTLIQENSNMLINKLKYGKITKKGLYNKATAHSILRQIQYLHRVYYSCFEIENDFFEDEYETAYNLLIYKSATTAQNFLFLLLEDYKDITII